VLTCDRNHPFVIWLKTRHNRARVPRTFLQKSYEESVIHSNWICTHISEMEQAGFDLHDPFVGHVVAIAASVQLEQMTGKDPVVSQTARRKFRQCCRFIKRRSEDWPNMLTTVRNSAKCIDRQALTCFSFGSWMSLRHVLLSVVLSAVLKMNMTGAFPLTQAEMSIWTIEISG